MKPSDFLKLGWCQGYYSLDIEGRGVHEKSPQAVSWCLTGAFMAADYDTDKAFALLTKEISSPAFEDWNDMPERTQAEVVALAERVERRLLGVGEELQHSQGGSA